MFDTTPPHYSIDSAEDQLEDPVAAVIAVEISRAFISVCMCRAEEIVTDLARQEVMLRKPGGIELAARLAAQRLYRRILPGVFELMRMCVPLAHAEEVLARTEDLLRTRFDDVVRTAAGCLLSADRDTAIQTMTVATTNAAHDIRGAFAAIVIDTRG